MQVFENQKIVWTLSQYSGWNYPKTTKREIILLTEEKIFAFLE